MPYPHPSLTECYAPDGLNPIKITHAGVSFTWSGGTLTLDPPQYGDTETVIRNRVVRNTRGKSLKHYRNTSWPEYRTFKWLFTHLTLAEITELRSILKERAGLEFQLYDHNNISWIVIITNPDIDFSNNGRLCNYSVELNFEAVLDIVPPPVE